MHWKGLKVWQKSHELALEIYRVTFKFPKEEIYGLTSQVKRAAISVPTNIVEGNSRNTTKDYINFLYTSRGSLEELRYLILLSQELEFMKADVHEGLESRCAEISLMINSLINKLKAK